MDMNTSKLGKVRGRASVIILFSVGADGGQAGHALDFAKAALDEWSASPASVPLSVYDSINAALESAGIYVTIVGVAFTAPTMGSKVVDSSMPELQEPLDVIYWLTVCAIGTLALLVCMGLRYIIKKRLKARRKRRNKYLLPKHGQLTVEQEKMLMQQYGMRPPMQGMPMASQTEPWAYPVQHGAPQYVAPGGQSPGAGYVAGPQPQGQRAGAGIVSGPTAQGQLAN
jgi:hypothetical protein